MKFSPKNIASRGRYDRKVTAETIRKHRKAFGKAEKAYAARPTKKNYTNAYRKRVELEDSIYARKLTSSVNNVAGGTALAGLSAFAARQAYKALKNKKSEASKATMRSIKGYGQAGLGVGAISGLSYLGTNKTKTAGAKMNAKQKANIVIRSGEVGVNDAMKSARTDAEKKAILAALRESKMKKTASMNKLLLGGAGLGALSGYAASDKGGASRGTAAGAVGGMVGSPVGALAGGAAGGALTTAGLMAMLKKKDPRMYKRVVTEMKYNPNKASFLKKLKRRVFGADSDALETKAGMNALSTIVALGGAGIGGVGGVIGGGALGGATMGRRDAGKQRLVSKKRERKYEEYK